MPRIAVITPTRNRAGKDGKGLLAETLESVRLQDADYVHIVVDDGSADCTPELVRSYPLDRTVYIHRKKPAEEKVTASIASNIGIQAVFEPERLPAEDRKKVEGVDVVTFLHSDDLLTEGSLSARIEAISETKAGMVYGVRYLIDGEGRIIGFENCPVGEGQANWRQILATYRFPNHTVTFDRRFLAQVGFFDPEIGYGEDVDMTVRSIKEARKSGSIVVGINKPTMYRRLHPDTVSAFYHENDLHDDDNNELKRKNVDSCLDALLVRGHKFLERPQAYLPSCIKRVLRPVRDAIRQYIREQKQEPYRDQFLEKIRSNVNGKQYTKGPLQASA